MKKTLLATGIASISIFATASYVGLVKSDEFDAVAELIKKEWSEWTEVGDEKCSDWKPETTEIDHGISFEQNRTCHQKEERSRDIYVKYEGSNQEEFKETEIQHRYISEEQSQNNIGQKDYVVGIRYDSWSNWRDKDAPYNCDLEWTPDPITITWGQTFTQTKDCEQDQERERAVYEVYLSGHEEFKEIEYEYQTVQTQITQEATGTKNQIDNERAEPWSAWTNVNGLYDCTDWSPEDTTIDWGINFIQTKGCNQDQTRSRDVYDVWSDGSETFNRTEVENQTIIEEETQNSVGKRDYVVSTTYDSWSNWIDKGALYNCTAYNPDASTINWGDSFTQTRDCSQDQERTRNVYEEWASGKTTLKTTESENKTIIETDSRTTTGTKDYITGTSYGSWGSYYDYGGLYSCSSYSPDPSTVNSGTTFTQTRTCKQDQRRSRSVYDVWASGKTTYKTTQYGYRTINETQSRTATGTKPLPYPATKSCPSGYSPSAYYPDKCYRNDAYYPDPGESCPPGWSTTPAGRCAVYTSVIYSCKSGDTLSGNMCYP